VFGEGPGVRAGVASLVCKLVKELQIRVSPLARTKDPAQRVRCIPGRE
jgi:hypothetical protein